MNTTTRPPLEVKKQQRRPKLDGEREANGRLKRPTADDKARRDALRTDPTMALNPLDAAFLGNWIGLDEFRAGRAYLALYRQTTPPDGPRVAQLRLPESDHSLDELRGRRLTSAEILQLWERIVGEEAPRDPEEAERRAAAAAAKWRAVNMAMTDLERAEVRAVCLHERWPRWVIARCNGEALRLKAAAEKRGLTEEELAIIARKFAPNDQRTLLCNALRKVAAALDAARPARSASAAGESAPRPARPQPEPPRPPIGTYVIEVIDYVDEEGEPLYTVERRRGR